MGLASGSLQVPELDGYSLGGAHSLLHSETEYLRPELSGHEAVLAITVIASADVAVMSVKTFDFACMNSQRRGLSRLFDLLPLASQRLFEFEPSSCRERAAAVSHHPDAAS